MSAGAADPVSERAARRLTELFVSPRCGLITRVEAQARGPEEPTPPWLSTADLAHFDFRNAPRAERLNAGKGSTEAQSRLSAMGEALERYSAYHWDPSRVRVGPPSDTAILPSDCVLHSPVQYAEGHLPYRVWSPETPTSWIEGEELPSGDPVDVPAGLVYLSWPLPRAEDHVAAVTSNGLAAGADLEHATLGALHELIERDALMITWLNRLPAARIVAPEHGCHAAAIIRHYRRHGVSVRLYRVATDQAATVVLAVAVNPDGIEPVHVVGMGCAERPLAAVDKAVFELCQARPSEAVRFREQNPGERLRRHEDVIELEDHPLFHGLAAHRREFDFLDDDSEPVTLDDIEPDAANAGQATPPGDAADELSARRAELERLVAGLTASGCRVARVDITAQDIRPSGVRVVRCFATGLQPIHFGHGQARLGGRRLFEAPRRWGLRERDTDEASLNPCPHPLA